MNHINFDGFSLIEVIVATSILSISVFGVYKLMSENNKIINNSSNFLQGQLLFPVLKECIDNIGINNFSEKTINKKYNFYLGEELDLCEISNTGNIIDNIDYILSSKIIGTGSNYINWELIIDSSLTGINTIKYKQIKK